VRHLRVVVVSLAVAFAFPHVTRVATAAAHDPTARRIVLLGRSVEGRAIIAVETGDFDSALKTLVVGCIHGNEPAGIAIADHVGKTRPPAEADIWVVPDLNPDGVAAETRGNAHGIDLNRNFPYRWQPLEGVYDSGLHPLSEPETRVVFQLLHRIRPSVSIWFHQHLSLVDDSSGNRTIERQFAQAVGLPLASLPREPGSAVTWESHAFPRASAFVVELPPGTLAPMNVARYANAVALATVTARLTLVTGP
jgi:protein MpaA